MYPLSVQCTKYEKKAETFGLPHSALRGVPDYRIGSGWQFTVKYTVEETMVLFLLMKENNHE